MISLSPDIGDLSPRLRFCSQQHSVEGDFDELFRKGQSRHTDQVAGALRSCRSVALFAHIARGGDRGVDIEDVERLLDYVVQRFPKRAKSLTALA